MSNENKEERYTKFPNLVLEALMKVKLSGNELRVLMVILRKTKGFHKDWDYISYGQFAKYIGILRCHASRLIKNLEYRNIIKVDKKSRINRYRINNKTMAWVPLDVTKNGNTRLPKTATKVLPGMVDTKERIKLLLKKEDYFGSIGE